MVYGDDDVVLGGGVLEVNYLKPLYLGDRPGLCERKRSSC